ncbi:hypothetical protein [Streptomyces chrestomyceticus]|uniref:hypothetical protein n=1 Tax=Streptomyces chrestomyceticus TaxID=68185 RepID=UPI0019D1AF43|nr:hypothetical protein [Streptomyces chrestomyceticus]
MRYFKSLTGRKGSPQLQTRPDTAGHPAHYTAANRPHSPPGAGSVRTAVRTAARAATRTGTRTGAASGPAATKAAAFEATAAEPAAVTPTGKRPATPPRMRTAARVRPPVRRRSQHTRKPDNTSSTRSPHHIPHPRTSRTPLPLLSVLGIFILALTLLSSGTAAAKGGKTPTLTAAGAAPVQAPDPTPTPAAPKGAHGTPTQVSPAQAGSSTGIQYRRDNERDPGREKDKDRNQARRCTRTAPGAPSPHRRPLPSHPCAARSYPTAVLFSAHTGTAAALTTSRPGVATRPALHCLHCVFRC